MSAAAATKENKMGTMPINKLLLNMSLPMMIAMLIQALYNIIDSMFVAQISENALSAVSLAFPMQNFMIAVGTGTGVGVNALLSKSLGAKRIKIANKTANISMFLVFMNWILFIIIGLFIAKPFLAGQTNVGEIVDYGNTYLRICCVASLGIYAEIALERLLQATGRTFYTMITQASGAIVNIILDPILIFGLFGMPELGVAGAAIATVCGQFVAAGLALFFNLTKNHDIKFDFRNMLPTKFIVYNIYKVAIPSILMVSIGSVMMFFMNRILGVFTPTAIAVFGVYFKLQSFIFMPIFGMNNGMVPIIAYNYGARKRERILHTIKLAVTYATVMMLIGLVIFQIIPDKLLLLFDASDNMLSIGVPALRLISISFVLAGFNIICSSVFQALGNGVFSLIVSVVRQLVVLVPVAFLLSKIATLGKIWLAFPIAEVAALLLCLFFLRKIMKLLDF
ncbi:MATE family efflux transporter [Anaerotignum lactatifermentans]|uniref:MATE family efflux transporter n=1 Tax=Anaerotignum lactatifermentans TaxID=160404 RepID=A0ABS2G600_9FIRM|nr:MATE family efflux transporter [Anaerotignum lactatifermentans]MBM6828247.1 MATE family efflux transporter [Anaerotignum lactatifermentans]MBM6876590.1 MATE family efflux transporter [Anaerotignum lactatifermentans]MBM6949830.1 MATE family efflux transporter [Anaerotignum lactatifermentans]